MVTQGGGIRLPNSTRISNGSRKRIYRHLFLSGYARLDYRMTEEGHFYLLEANPNPQIARGEDFADSAAYSGVTLRAVTAKDHHGRVELSPGSSVRKLIQ